MRPEGTKRAQLLGVLLVCAVALLHGRARAQPSVAGAYKAGPTEVHVEVSTWGSDCGTRPRSHTDNEQPKVSVRAQGDHLVLTFPDRTLRTDACWSENPTLRVAGAPSATAARWRAECRTPEGEAKRERGIYTVSASAPGVLELVDESDYNWQLNESRCVAKMRTTQRLVREGTTQAPEASTGCTPGPLARLKLRPTEARIAPGARVCFTVRGFDAAGCAVPRAPEVSFSLEASESARGTLSGNCFKAARGLDGEGRFAVTASSGSVHASANLLVATNDLSDITARRDNTDEARDEDAETGESSASVFGIEAVVGRSSLGVKLLVSALLLAIVGALSWLLLQRTRRLHAARESRITPTPALPRRRRTTQGVQGGASGPPLICPACRQGYPPGTKHCPKDGRVPIPYAEFIRQQEQAAPARTCPSCGAQLAPGATFCGACGTRVSG